MSNSSLEAKLELAFPLGNGDEQCALLWSSETTGILEHMPTWKTIFLNINQVDPKHLRKMSNVSFLYVLPGILLAILSLDEERAAFLGYHFVGKLKFVSESLLKQQTEEQLGVLVSLFESIDRRGDVFDDMELNWFRKIGLMSKN